MAPEQHGGDPVTAVADQFAFATALWSALYGAARRSRARRSRSCATKIAKGPRTPAGRHVPGHIEAALRRALALKPQDRWPTLAALLGELAYDPLARRRRWALGGAVACVVLAVGAASFGIGRTVSQPAVCSGGAALVASVWDDSARESVRAAFRGTGRPTPTRPSRW